MESSFQKGGKWESEGQQQQWKGEGEEERTAVFSPCILTEFFSEMPMFFEHIDSVTLFSCLNSPLERIKLNPNLFLGSVLFCIPLRSEGNRKDKWCDNHRPHKKKKSQIGEKQLRSGLIFRDFQCNGQISSMIFFTVWKKKNKPISMESKIQ